MSQLDATIAAFFQLAKAPTHDPGRLADGAESVVGGVYFAVALGASAGSVGAVAVLVLFVEEGDHDRERAAEYCADFGGGGEDKEN